MNNVFGIRVNQLLGVDRIVFFEYGEKVTGRWERRTCLLFSSFILLLAEFRNYDLERFGFEVV
jgi:hypothetical protein